MAFVKKTWKDRIAEFPTRRRLTKEDNTSELVTVAREEGTLSQEGDAFSAENMNDLENRIDAEFTEVNGKLIRQYNQLAKVTSKQTITIDVTDCFEFCMGRANTSNELNDIICFDRGMLDACSVQIAATNVVVATASLDNNTLTIELSVLTSGYFYVFGK